MKKLLLAATLVAAPFAVSAETVVLEGKLGTRRGVVKFYDAISNQYCVGLQSADGIALQCTPLGNLDDGLYIDIQSLVKQKQAEQSGN